MENMQSDLLTRKHAHLVGIKGVAMTATALCLRDAGLRVTGSDTEEEFVTQAVLDAAGFTINSDFVADHITADTDVVIYTGAHNGKSNIEVQTAIKLGIPVMSQAEALGKLLVGKKVISVCGAGGKSTTSAMIAWILESAGLRPSFAVGVGNIPNFGVPGRFVADSDWFVVEADEYAVDPTCDKRPRFIYQDPEVVVCTSLAYDHPDIYPNFDATKATFAAFFQKAESVYVNADNPDLFELFSNLREVDNIDFESCGVGFGQKADYRLHSLPAADGKNHFTLEYVGFAERQPWIFGKDNWQGRLEYPGSHILIDAGLAMLAARDAGVEFALSLPALADFRGTMRRFEYKGSLNGALLYDDYAHTPTEIVFTLTALKQKHPGKRIVAAFQPHTFSRTKALFNEFVHAFHEADELLLLDVFASAREQNDPTVSSDLLRDSIQQDEPKVTVKNVKTIEGLATEFVQLNDEDVFITLGAGDIYKVYEKVGGITGV